MTLTRPGLEMASNCWQAIGVWGDRSCPELAAHTHCHNCPVFATAGRRFLDAAPPAGYRDEWTDRLAAPADDATSDTVRVLVFRMADEWLALPIGVMVEVTRPLPPHRVPHRGGLIAGLVNVRGELHLCVRLDLLFGITPTETPAPNPRLLIIRKDGDTWAFPADEVDRVRAIDLATLRPPPPTLSRASAHVSRGIFQKGGHPVGLLDETRLFQTIRERCR